MTFDKTFVVSRLPHPAEIYRGVELSVPVKIRDFTLSSYNLILSTLPEAGTK